MNYLLCVTDGKRWRTAVYSEHLVHVPEWRDQFVKLVLTRCEMDEMDLTNAELFSMKLELW